MKNPAKAFITLSLLTLFFLLYLFSIFSKLESVQAQDNSPPKVCGFNIVVGQGTDNYIPKWKDQATLENSIIYQKGVNIGIGTNNPEYKLHINALGTGTTTRGIAIDSGDNNRLLIGYDYDVGDWIQFRPENAKGLAFLYGPDSVMMVISSSTRNVGINTTTPDSAYRLYVAGKVGATGDICANLGSGAPKCLSNISGSGGGTNYWNLSGNSLYPASTTWKVGIGTSTPNYKLDVFNGAIVSSAPQGQPWGIGIMIPTNWTGGWARQYAFFASDGTQLGAIGMRGFGVTTSEMFIGQGINQSGTSTGIRWISINTGNGNVGIGTSTPQYKLQVEGKVGIGAPFQGSWIYFRNGNGSFDIGNLGKYTNSTSTNKNILYLQNKDDPIAIAISSSAGWNVPAIFYKGGTVALVAGGGNVGIGTTAPNYKLDVFNGAIVSSAPQGQPWGIGIMIPTNWTGGWARQYAFFASDGTQLGAIGMRGFGTTTTEMFIGQGINQSGSSIGTRWISINTGNGNVGIGTSAPAQKLDVVGGYIRSDTGFCIGANCITNWSGVAGGGNYWNLSGNSLYPASTTWNVGIGTNNPLAKLHISPSIPLQDVFRVDVYSSSKWQYKRKISIVNNNSIGAFNYQIPIKLDTSTGPLRQSLCNDVRFVDSFGNQLSFWYDLYTCGTRSTVFWVRIPYLGTGENIIYMHYGNPFAERAANIYDTFYYNKIFLVTGVCDEDGTVFGVCGYTIDTGGFDKIRGFIKSKRVFGSTMVSNISQNYNINSPQENDHYYSRYKFLFVPKNSGRFVFKVSSDDTSELYLLTNHPDDYFGGDLNYKMWDGTGNTLVHAQYYNRTTRRLYSITPTTLNLVGGRGYWFEYAHTEWEGNQWADLSINDLNNVGYEIFTRNYLPGIGTRTTFYESMVNISIGQEEQNYSSLPIPGLVVDYQGNVGIGMFPSARAKLEVKGGINFNNNKAMGYVSKGVIRGDIYNPDRIAKPNCPLGTKPKIRTNLQFTRTRGAVDGEDIIGVWCRNITQEPGTWECVVGDCDGCSGSEAYNGNGIWESIEFNDDGTVSNYWPSTWRGWAKGIATYETYCE